jgi:retinol dehydrogenase 12
MGNHSSFVPERDIPSLKGKVIFITGGNEGIGKQTALELSRHEPLEIWIAARDRKKATQAITEIKAASPEISIRFAELDLSSYASVKACANNFLASAARLDILICNAGLMAGGLVLSKEGYELRMAVNHLGHALLINLLVPLMLQTATLGGKPRVVSLASAGHRFVPKEGIEFESLRSNPTNRTPVDMYCQAKLAQILWARELAKRYPEITSVSINPGDVKTNLYTDSKGPWYFEIIKLVAFPFIGTTLENGAKNSLWAATSKSVVNGEYYDPVGKGNTASTLSQDKELLEKLVNWTDEALKK